MPTRHIETPPPAPMYRGFPVRHEAANFGGLQQVLTSTAKALDDFHIECEAGGRCYVLIELADAGDQYNINRNEDEEMESYTLVRRMNAVTVVQLDADLAEPIASKQRSRVREGERLKKDGQQSLTEQRTDGEGDEADGEPGEAESTFGSTDQDVALLKAAAKEAELHAEEPPSAPAPTSKSGRTRGGRHLSAVPAEQTSGGDGGAVFLAPPPADPFADDDEAESEF